ncbi:MAG: phosphomannose isomerase type II C-terminal cupin domain [Flavobacteriaceae bacterium]|nr:phosphomannose isomerase type II C-terminal cupin domain [Flavobacteriaceae bacterium]
MEVGERPWGKYYVLEDKPTHKVKRIEVNPDQRLSYQYHHHRSEVWTIIQGQALVILDDEENHLTAGEVILIPQGAKHRIKNSGQELLIFVEVQHGTYFGEDDIIRIQDDYSRD